MSGPVEITDPRLVASMLDPGFYPDPAQTVELLQTHISYVFVAGDFVYKVKKPVDFGFLDFTTLESRRHYCLEEMRLNRRLAPEAYLAVLPIVEAVPGAAGAGLSLGAEETAATGSRPLEYVLKMKRLPEEGMLKLLLARGRVGPGVMEAIARKVAAFHALADTGGEVDEVGGPASVWRNSRENFEQTRPYIGLTVPEWQHRFLDAYDAEFYHRNLALLERRVQEHRIRDCHGDLHLEHICLSGEGALSAAAAPTAAPGAGDITIFDCIEFNKRFRYGDVGLEVAFLAMDLDFNGYEPLAAAFVDAYVQASGDGELPLLLNFFACYRAYVRGKVISFRLDDPAISAEDRHVAATTASRYFDLAYRYAARLEQPTLLLVGGLMGSGKSRLSRGLSGLLGAEVLQMDVIRKELVGVPPTERHFDDFGAGLYSAHTTRRTYDEAIRRAERMLKAGRSVIIDASWSRRADRRRAAAAARRAGAETVMVEARCPEEMAKERLERRVARVGHPSDGRWEIYAAQKAAFEEVREGEEDGRAVVVNCTGAREASVAQAVCAVRVSMRKHTG